MMTGRLGLHAYVGRPLEDVLCIQEDRVVGAEAKSLPTSSTGPAVTAEADIDVLQTARTSSRATNTSTTLADFDGR
jgi:hypothetical protein